MSSRSSTVSGGWLAGIDVDADEEEEDQDQGEGEGEGEREREREAGREGMGESRHDPSTNEGVV